MKKLILLLLPLLLLAGEIGDCKRLKVAIPKPAIFTGVRVYRLFLPARWNKRTEALLKKQIKILIKELKEKK